MWMKSHSSLQDIENLRLDIVVLLILPLITAQLLWVDHYNDGYFHLHDIIIDIFKGPQLMQTITSSVEGQNKW